MQIGSALDKLIKNNQWGNKIIALKIEENWETIMGKTIAKYTDKVYFSKGTLTIQTSVAPLKQELQHSKEKIIQLVNDFLKEKAVYNVIIR